jgi:membrane-associated phospholipid phosphatase
VSVAGEVKPAPGESAAARHGRFIGNVQAWFRLLGRSPRALPARPAWRAPGRLAIWALVSLALIGSAMVLIDVPAITAARTLPLKVTSIFNWLTDFGTSDWFLVPIAFVLAAIAAIASPALTKTSRLVLTVVAIRLGFLFAAIAVPGLLFTIAKRLIGRARPFVSGQADPFLYHPFSWAPEYASLPSGHATNVFLVLTAFGLLWPWTRAPMLLYALTIAASRVILTAHHPSDVIAGAIAGIFGALLVRDWFAARRLGFAIGPDGKVRALPGPSWRRLIRVARQSAAQ